MYDVTLLRYNEYSFWCHLPDCSGLGSETPDAVGSSSAIV